MSFLAKIFGKKKSHTEENKQGQSAVTNVSVKNPEERTREDLERDLAVITQKNPETGALITRAPGKKEKSYLKQTLDFIEKVSGGKEMLDDIAKKGYRIVFSEKKNDESKESYRTDKDWYSRSAIMLSLDSHKTTQGLALSCMHFLGCIKQHEQLKAAGIVEKDLNMADQIRLDRAQTVARYALEAELVVQMSKIEPNDKGGLSLTLPHGLEQVFAIHPPIKAYAQEMLNTAGDRGKSVEKVADSFCEATHDVKYYRDAYEQTYIRNIINGLNNSPDNRTALQKSLTPEEMVKVSFVKLFQKNVSPDFLKSEEMNSLSENALNKLQAISEECEKAGIKDKSFKQLYPHDLRLSYKEMKKLTAALKRNKKEQSAETKKPAKAAFMAKIKQEGR